MLEVHPPHAAVHSWRDFGIHIVTIVCGLLIAVGIEQVVTRIHEHNEIAETRAALAHEHRLNARISAVLTTEYRRITPVLKRDLAVFVYRRQHPDALKADWPGTVDWSALNVSYLHSAWDTAQSRPILALMPPGEVRRYSELNSRLRIADESYEQFVDAINAARAYLVRDPDPANLSQAEVAREIDLLTTVLQTHAKRGRAMASMHVRFPDFAAPSTGEVGAISGILPSPEGNKVNALFDEVQKIKDEATHD